MLRTYDKFSWDKKTRKFRHVKTAKPKDRKEKFGRYVITVARRISERGVFTGVYVVDIRGNFLCEALSDIYHDVDGVNFPRNVSLVSYGPHCMKDIAKTHTTWSGHRRIKAAFSCEIGPCSEAGEGKSCKRRQ
jgi:hypothetical protein